MCEKFKVTLSQRVEKLGFDFGLGFLGIQKISGIQKNRTCLLSFGFSLFGYAVLLCVCLQL